MLASTIPSAISKCKNLRTPDMVVGRLSYEEQLARTPSCSMLTYERLYVSQQDSLCRNSKFDETHLTFYHDHSILEWRGVLRTLSCVIDFALCTKIPYNFDLSFIIQFHGRLYSVVSSQHSFHRFQNFACGKVLQSLLASKTVHQPSKGQQKLSATKDCHRRK